jgi:MFS superfamily sulfate permease-like transporter
MKNRIKKDKPKDWVPGLKENFSSDAISGFLVFLLALPLSLGIAKASDFPAIFGLMTAMVGGVLVSLIAGSKLTIKGPAAGLIVIVAGSVAELGHGDNILGWKLALGAIVIAGVIQVLFGFLKLGKLNDFFPLSAVHGMLAAIGIIIISKQIHILAGVTPMTAEGKSMVEPLELLELIPNTLMNFFAHKEVVFVGLISLLIVFGWPRLKVGFLKKIPAPLVVLAVSIPLSMALGIHNVKEVVDANGNVISKAFNPLVSFDKGFFDILGINVSFGGFDHMGTFIKYIVMFALVGSLEALLTVKAIDMLDPWKRKSDYNKDLIAVGIGNIVAGVLGGLPMISEVARSSANVANGGKTRWANFFHGIFILIFLIFAVSFSDLIPNAALAAMLIGVGFKLSHPKEFGHMAKIGLDQIVVFIVTIVFTLATDLLIGIAAGILLKLIIHLFNGAPLKALFSAKTKVQGNRIIVNGSAVFSNFIGIKNKIDTFKYSDKVVFDVTNCKLVDHTVIENLYHIKDDFENEGGEFIIEGIEELKPVSKKSKHKYAAVKRMKNKL